MSTVYPFLTAAVLTANDPIVPKGELWIESDTHKAKVGNGATAWTALAYWNPFDSTSITVDDLTVDAVEINGALNHDGTTAGFFNVTPTTRPTAYTQTFSTADKTHAARTATVLTVVDGVGTNNQSIAAITDNASTIAAVQELAAAINALIVDVADTAGVVNALVDDLQALGLVT